MQLILKILFIIPKITNVPLKAISGLGNGDKKHKREAFKKDMIEEQMYIHFFTYHIYGNNIKGIKNWEIFNEKVEKPASKFYSKWKDKLPPITSKPKDKNLEDQNTRFGV